MPFRCVHLSTSFILRQVFDLFFISLHSLKLCAAHYTQCTETTYFRCRHYTQYYQARIFFHFITSLTTYVHLITISHLRQFRSVVYISLYLFIFRFFFILLHPSIIQRTHFRCADLPPTCYFVNFWVVLPPIVLQHFMISDSCKASSAHLRASRDSFAGKERALPSPGFD